MSGITVIDSALIFTTCIAALISVLVLVFPAVWYYRGFDKMQQSGKSAIEIFVNTFGLHFAIIMIVLAMCIAWSWVTEGSNMENYSISTGMKLFYGFYDKTTGAYSCSGQTFWDFWNDMAHTAYQQYSTGTSSGKLIQKGVVAAIFIINLAQVFLWFILVIYPYIILLIPFFYMTRKDVSRQETDNTIIQKLQGGFIIFLVLLTLSLVHFKMASVFVTSLTSDGTNACQFDYYKIMQTAQAEILR